VRSRVFAASASHAPRGAVSLVAVAVASHHLTSTLLTETTPKHSAIVVTLIATAIVPLALKPGDDAAQKIFSAKQKAPLDKQGPPKGKSRR
jgi:hypothetical protein